MADVAALLAFLRHAERLKTVTRTAWSSTGRPESVAEHTWRLCLAVIVLERDLPGIDVGRLLRMCVVHDLGEAIHGDIPAIAQGAGGDKSAQERADLCTLLAPLPDDVQADVLALWDEYEAAETPEAKLAKALDKLETILQHNQGANPGDFDYRFNLGYGRRYTGDHPLVVAIREALDAETEQRARESERRT